MTLQFMKDTITCLLRAQSIGSYSPREIAMDTLFRRQHNQQSFLSLSAIFFDLDNTLVETRKVDNQACRKITDG
ncbi:hypothetical protein ACS0PU_000582 [Formica fusca]